MYTYVCIGVYVTEMLVKMLVFNFVELHTVGFKEEISRSANVYMYMVLT